MKETFYIINDNGVEQVDADTFAKHVEVGLPLQETLQGRSPQDISTPLETTDTIMARVAELDESDDNAKWVKAMVMQQADLIKRPGCKGCTLARALRKMQYYWDEYTKRKQGSLNEEE